MKGIRNLLKPAIFLMVGFLVIFSMKSNNIFRLQDKIKTSLKEGLKVVKITEERSVIKEKKIDIDERIKKIHYEDDTVERYINSYVRKNINEFINQQIQLSDINNNGYKEDIEINYQIVYEDESLINLIIYKSTKWGRKEFKLEKDSYVFDLKTGQRIYLDNFLKENEDYKHVIEKYIFSNLENSNSNEYKNKINIDKDTNYYISDGGINIYFNPYKESKSNDKYEFKIPYDIFKTKIKMVKTDDIVANIDTQTINKKDKYINSVINIPIVMTENKQIEKSINDKIRNDIMDFYNKSQEEAKKFLKDFPEDEGKFVANTNFEIKKNSNNMLSILVTYYKYSGGAHGDYNNIAYNIYMKNGEFLNLSDLFKYKVNYKEVINNEIRKQIEDMAKKDKENAGVYQFTTISDNQKFYIQDDNIVIFFDLYEIAPYAAGIPEFKINIKSLNHILKDDYVSIFK